jgi:hypothetical protein
MQIFRLETTGRKCTCGCGKELPGNSEQFKVATGFTRFGLTTKYFCRECALKYHYELVAKFNRDLNRVI